MGIHKVLIIPGYGQRTDNGVIDKGRSIGKVTEMDVVNAYKAFLIDELESQRIAYKVMEVGLKQQIHPTLRHKLVEPNTMILHLKSGWFNSADRTLNQSTVYYATSKSSQLAEELTECLHDWGHCLVHGHRSANPVLLRGKSNAFLSVPSTIGVMIEPFALNGPKNEVYLDNLDNLGRNLGIAIANFAKIREKNMFSVPPSHYGLDRPAKRLDPLSL